MKKFFILIFLSCSMFFVISAFYRKSMNKEPIGFQYVMYELSNAHIGFDINEDISQLSKSMSELYQNNSEGGSNVFDVVVKIGKTIYYGIKFLIQFVFHSLIATINVIICVIRIIGFDTIPYIETDKIFGSSGGSGGRGGNAPDYEGVIPPVIPVYPFY